MVTRRQFLLGAGAVLVAVSGGVLYRALDTGVFGAGTGEAYVPWQEFGKQENKVLNIVHAAILAANPHNTQPWQFHVTDSQIDVYADTTRNIGAIDPFLREMYMGLGCALENLRLAARAEGFEPALHLLPTPADARHAARLDLKKAQASREALYEMIPRRHTDRGAYDTTRAIAASDLAELGAYAQDENLRVVWLTDAPQMEKFRALTLEATRAIIDDEQQANDSFKWQRLTWQELQTQRDGITYDVQGLGAGITALVKMLPPLSRAQSDAGWFEGTRDRALGTAQAFGLILARDVMDNTQRLRGGRLWQTMHLDLTRRGISAQPLNQTSERRDREVQLNVEPRIGNGLRELVGNDTWHVLMPFRIGYPTVQTLPSPRRAPEAVLLG